MARLQHHHQTRKTLHGHGYFTHGGLRQHPGLDRRHPPRHGPTTSEFANENRHREILQPTGGAVFAHARQVSIYKKAKTEGRNWSRRRESNPHGTRSRQILSLLRLPVPPLRENSIESNMSRPTGKE